MPMDSGQANTPYYVLMDGNRRIGPLIAPLPPGTACAPIYGFSGADAYHAFRKNSNLPLTPYPLVKVYLRTHAADAGDNVKLVVVDAAGPGEPCLFAATIGAVLEAHEKRNASVNTNYSLTLDRETSSYSVYANE